VLTCADACFIWTWLGLNMINMSTKLELSTFIHYEDTKGNIKCRNWTGSGRLGITQGHSSSTQPFDRVHMISNFTSIETMCLSWYRFQVITSYLSKAVDFNLPHLNLVPIGSDTIRISHISLVPENKSPWAVWHCLHDHKFSLLTQ